MSQLSFLFEQFGENDEPQFIARSEGDIIHAFTFEIKGRIPTITVKARREEEWYTLYPDLKGPEFCVMYFGPENRPGRLAYGTMQERSMVEYLWRPNQSSPSIYFMAQNRQVYKWKQVGRTIECINTQTNRTVAQYDDGHQLPQMRIWGEGAFISTELFVTWYLSMTAKRCSWRIYTPRELSNLRR